MSSDRLLPSPFFFIRHGQTDWNVEQRIMGQTDIPLNRTGIEQAKHAASFLKGYPITHIAYSPLLRAYETAQIMNEVLHCPMTPIEALKEFSLGEYEGQYLGAWFDEWRHGRISCGVESYRQFINRSLQGIVAAQEIAQDILIVAHGGTYWAIQEHVPTCIHDLMNCTPLKCIPHQIRNEPAANQQQVLWRHTAILEKNE